MLSELFISMCSKGAVIAWAKRKIMSRIELYVSKGQREFPTFECINVFREVTTVPSLSKNARANMITVVYDCTSLDTNIEQKVELHNILFSHLNLSWYRQDVHYSCRAGNIPLADSIPSLSFNTNSRLSSSTSSSFPNANVSSSSNTLCSCKLSWSW